MNLIEEQYLRQKIRNILNEDFRFQYEGNNFFPTSEMKSACQYAINAVTKNKLTGKGENEGSGLRKAKSIISGEAITHAQLKRMKSFFDNNLQSYNQEKALGKSIFNSGVIQKWNLWGGDASYSWVSNHLKSHGSKNQKSKDNRPKGHSKMMDPTNTRTRTAFSQIQNSLGEVKSPKLEIFDSPSNYDVTLKDKFEPKNSNYHSYRYDFKGKDNTKYQALLSIENRMARIDFNAPTFGMEGVVGYLNKHDSINIVKTLYDILKKHLDEFDELQIRSDKKRIQFYKKAMSYYSIFELVKEGSEFLMYKKR